MRKRIVLTAIVSMLLLSTILGVRFTSVVMASPSVIRVPTPEFPTIQAAINASGHGDTIRVAAGTYYEHVRVNKTVSLVGEDPTTTIIDGGGIGTVVLVIASNVKIEGLTIQNGGEWPYSGVLLSRSSGHTISNNIIRENGYNGLELRQSNSSSVIGNLITGNSVGIVLSISYGNNIINNEITNNSIGVLIHSPGNTFYRNNFVNNTNQAPIIVPPTSWDNGAEGNYWSDYEGSDLNGDGIGDTAYPDGLGGWDKYPLLEPWSLTRVFHVGAYDINVKRNSTIASFNFNQTLRQISFKVTGPSGNTFFCNVTVPKALLNVTSSEKWLIKLNNTDVSSTSIITEDVYASHIYFVHGLSTYDVRIQVVKAEEGKVVDLTPYVVGGGVAIGATAVATFVILKKKKKH